MNFRTFDDIKPTGETKQAITYFKRVGCLEQLVEVISKVDEIISTNKLENGQSLKMKYAQHLAKFGKNPQVRERLPLAWEWLIRSTE